MKLKSFLEKLFLGETLTEKIDSPISGEIRIYDGWFGKSMMIGGITQSGWLVEKLWRIGIRAIRNMQYEIRNVLILGLGCGCAAEIVAKEWPECKIVGVEIDPVVIEVGRKYFNLNDIDNLKIEIKDAIHMLVDTQRIAKNSHMLNFCDHDKISLYDLILVDLYIGRDFPKEVESEEFLNGVKNILAKNGIAIFNRLSYGDLKEKAAKFSEKLQKYFPKVWTKKTITNLLIFCQK